MVATGSLQLKAVRGDGDRCRNNFVAISASDLLAANIAEGSAVEVCTERGRRLVARVLPVTHDDANGVLYLDRHQLAALKPALDELVTLRPIEIADAKRVTLEPLSALDENLASIEQEIAEKLTAAEQLVCSGMLLPMELKLVPRGLMFRVVSVEPASGRVAAGTRVVLRSGRLMPGAAANLVTFADIGGLDIQIQQIHELVEMPLRFPKFLKTWASKCRAGFCSAARRAREKPILPKRWPMKSARVFFYINGPERGWRRYASAPS